MDIQQKEVRSPRKGAKLGDRIILAGQPIMVVKSGKQEDFFTAEEIIEALYDVPVDHIVFKQASS